MSADEYATLIEPLRSGRDLLDEIASTVVPPGRFALWWLGQSGYLIKSKAGTLVIDPYLSEHLTQKYAGTDKPHVRMTRSPIRGQELSGVDAVLTSHKHSDHIDPGTLPGLLETSTEARLVVPAALVAHAEGLGLPADRIDPIDAGQTKTIAGFEVQALASAHEDLDTDDQGRHLYLGFIVSADGWRIYHSGDTMLYPGLVETLVDEPLDLLLLPINGRDPARGVAGNMSAADVVDLASVVPTRFVIPHHYDMFTFNTVPVSDFETETQRLPESVTSVVLQCGERWILPEGGTDS